MLSGSNAHANEQLPQKLMFGQGNRCVSVTGVHFESSPDLVLEGFLVSCWFSITIRFEVVSLSSELRQTMEINVWLETPLNMFLEVSLTSSSS